jgi:hypothetical protein
MDKRQGMSDMPVQSGKPTLRIVGKTSDVWRTTSTNISSASLASTRPNNPLAANYFANAVDTGNFSTSRASCWMMTVAFKFVAIFFRRSIDATVCARSKLNAGTPSVS